MTGEDDDILDGMFHGCALAAYPRPGRGRAGLAFERGYPRPGLPLLRRSPRREEPAGNPPLPLTRPVELYRTIQTPERRQPMIANPTHRTYTSLDAAYDHFNRELFGGQLPPCLITMQRHKGAYGYFSGERFASLDNPRR